MNMNMWVVMVMLFMTSAAALGLASASAATQKKYDTTWQNAVATWYGDPEGSGSNGGACGYGNTVNSAPLARHTTAASPAIYQNGHGCGECFKIRCTGQNSLCAANAVTVTVMDECPGCSGVHFDLSGSSFGAMATAGNAAQLRNMGQLQIQYKRVPCGYGGTPISFKVDQGSTAYWFSIVIAFADQEGSFSQVSLRQSGRSDWQSMQEVWGANYALTSGPLTAPFSLQVVSLSKSATLTAFDVIPAGWSPGSTYTTTVKFKSASTNAADADNSTVFYFDNSANTVSPFDIDLGLDDIDGLYNAATAGAAVSSSSAVINSQSQSQSHLVGETLPLPTIHPQARPQTQTETEFQGQPQSLDSLFDNNEPIDALLNRRGLRNGN